VVLLRGSRFSPKRTDTNKAVNIEGRGLSVKSRHYFSMSFIVAAAHLASEAKRIEDGYDGVSNEYLQEHHVLHRGLVVAAVVSSASCLEAWINEFFSDADEPHVATLKPLSESIRETMAGLWNLGIPRTAKYSILEKYNIAYFVIKNKKLDMSRNPAQDVGCLVQLRNALVHYEPNWQEHESIAKDAHRLEKIMKSRISICNKLTGGPNPFYPDKLLGYGCAKWAVETSVNFINNFCNDIGVLPPYQNIELSLELQRIARTNP